MFSLCTLEFWVCRLDPPVEQTAASLLSLLDDCSSGPALSDGRGWISELRPEKHSLPLWSDILTACRHTKQQHTSHDLRSLQDWKVVCLLLSSVRIVKEESATVRWLDEEVQETHSDYNECTSKLKPSNVTEENDSVSDAHSRIQNRNPNKFGI